MASQDLLQDPTRRSRSSKHRPVGIMSAMAPEIQGLESALDSGVRRTNQGNRTYVEGKLREKSVVLTFSRWGKVSAAATAVHLITRFNVRALVFTGVAGSLDENVNIGDVVVGSKLVQHDMNASPLFKRHEVPLTGKTYFEANDHLREIAVIAAKSALGSPTAGLTKSLCGMGIRNPLVHEGIIASGDQFVANSTQRSEIVQRLPGVLAVEMEGAAVAQVCHDYSVPFVVIRSISDSADSAASCDFDNFVTRVASAYGYQIVDSLIGAIR